MLSKAAEVGCAEGSAVVGMKLGGSVGPFVGTLDGLKVGSLVNGMYINVDTLSSQVVAAISHTVSTFSSPTVGRSSYSVQDCTILSYSIPTQ